MTKEIDVRDIREVDRMWALKHIDVEHAWEHTDGEGVKVAILDSGASLKHPDLEPNIVDYKDFTGSKYGAEDRNGHGSHVAGIIGAVRDDKGIVGVAPKSSLYIAKVLKDNGKGDFEAVIKAIEWAISQEVDIITMSLGARTSVPERLHYVIKKAHSHGIIMMAAAGNKNEEVSYPAAYEEVIAVSATDENHQKADFSNFGIANEIAAPGTEILSTFKNKGYAVLSGTSMATPIVAGAGALFISYYRKVHKETPCLNKTRRFLNQSIHEKEVEGRDDLFGSGILTLKDFSMVVKKLGDYC